MKLYTISMSDARTLSMNLCMNFSYSFILVKLVENVFEMNIFRENQRGNSISIPISIRCLHKNQIYDGHLLPKRRAHSVDSDCICMFRIILFFLSFFGNIFPVWDEIPNIGQHRRMKIVCVYTKSQLCVQFNKFACIKIFGANVNASKWTSNELSASERRTVARVTNCEL